MVGFSRKEALNQQTISQAILLLALVGQLIVLPLFEQHPLVRFLVNFTYTLMFVSGVLLFFSRRSQLVPALPILLIVVSISWVSYFVDHPTLFVVDCVLDAFFFAMLAGFLVVRVMKRHLATLQSVFGSVNAYLLLGLAWAMLYWATERIEGETLDFPNPPASTSTNHPEKSITSFSTVVYFSFVTMSTLGYGDIRPATPMTRTLAWMQSVTGQFYLAILVARVVSAIPIRRQIFEQEEKREKTNPPPVADD